MTISRPVEIGDHNMLPLDDPRWRSLNGGYHTPFDAAPRLETLFSAGPTVTLWADLWAGLHHQGDVDQASYAAVPHLVEYLARSQQLDDQALAMVATIELHRPLNPPPLAELEAAYREAIERLPSLIGNHAQNTWDERTTRGAVACIALARGQRRLASVYLDLDIDTCRDALEEAGINVVDA
jgi:hypothetical protein